MPRKPFHLSPTSFALFLESQDKYYLRYCADYRPPNEPQNQAMSIGSSFDAYVKSYLHDKLYGKGSDPRFDLKAIFESQVEEHNRDWAWENGKYVFQQYKDSGALADLVLDLEKRQGEARFEFEIKGVINGYREGTERIIDNVVLLGKPDIAYITSQGVHVILDFKVNGYCSSYNTSPMQGYVRLRQSGGVNYGQHRNAMLGLHEGMLINIGDTLEHFKKDWATQLSFYAWLCGEPVGSDFIVAIDQICCSPTKGLPQIRVAQHRLKISEKFQKEIFSKACKVWDIVCSDHFFRDLSLEDSQARCKVLNEMHAPRELSDNDQWLRSLTR